MEHRKLVNQGHWKPADCAPEEQVALQLLHKPKEPTPRLTIPKP
eukprot:CAMPEP_0198153134 /NCGR_PEP_ID=MMETSP1443-20131203/62832_1 /TAXON_ID=186043 /ORGANISM="Entomoneis sp., Strain CCMP2396" /LENGTH=43 /DNA_ID= /DNA_START= /DNA_END= /DNA_ORIENTATION=